MIIKEAVIKKKKKRKKQFPFFLMCIDWVWNGMYFSWIPWSPASLNKQKQKTYLSIPIPTEQIYIQSKNGKTSSRQ